MKYKVIRNGKTVLSGKSLNECRAWVKRHAQPGDSIIDSGTNAAAPPLAISGTAVQSSPPNARYEMTPLRHDRFVLRDRWRCCMGRKRADCVSYLRRTADPNAWVDERVSPGRPGMLTPVRVVVQ